MGKKNTKKKSGAKIVKPNSENYTFLNPTNIQLDATHEEHQGSETPKEIERLRHDSRNVKFSYRSKNIRTKQGHSPVYE